MKTLKITTYWTTEQAEDICTLLDDLKSTILQSYGEDISKMHREIINEEQKKKENDEFNDGLLF